MTRHSPCVVTSDASTVRKQTELVLIRVSAHSLCFCTITFDMKIAFLKTKKLADIDILLPLAQMAEKMW